MFELEQYDFNLPPELIAQVPAPRRDGSRVLVVDRSAHSLCGGHFFELPRVLRPGDLLVVNNTKVVPAKLYGRKDSGGRVEVLVLDHPAEVGSRTPLRACLLKSSKRPRKGTVLYFDSGARGCVEDVLEDGMVMVSFEAGGGIDALLDSAGRMPLPPYIKRGEDDGGYESLDRERYQTVYSRTRGSVAAPTAGLHFTPELMTALGEAGIEIALLTLHVGYGTFRPVRTNDIRNHALGVETYHIPEETVEAIRCAKERGGRVVAVGTTVVRTLETAGSPGGGVTPGVGRTGLLVTPGFTFNVVDALITNFHLPKSSLLFLVSAFAGIELIREAYELAVRERYRFFSYGDAMLIV